jgi:cystathionine beta-lyase/cystathionine gamma-synthase
MRKYVSLGSALMMGVVLGKETKADIKPILAQKHYIGEVVYM